MGEVVQLRDYQNPKDLERMRRDLEQQAVAMIAEWHTLSGGIDALDTSPCEMNPEPAA